MSAARGLALLRIGLGVELAIWAWAKTSEGWLEDGSALAEVLAGYLPQSQTEYARFLESFVLPNVDLFAKLVTLAEWTAAGALVLGLFTRAGALLAMWLMVNFMLMRGPSDVSASIDRLFFLVCLVCFVTSAGRVLGLDGLGHRPQRVTNAWANPRAATAAAQPLLARPTRSVAYEPATSGPLASPFSNP